MAKKTAETTNAPKVKRTPKAPLDITFGTWLKSARARGEVGALVIELKSDKKIKDDAKLANVSKRYADRPGFDVIASRYEGFLKRGYQSKKAA